MAVERLHIEIQETGAAAVGQSFQIIADRVLAAGGAFGKLKKDLKSFGISSLAKQLSKLGNSAEMLGRNAKKAGTGVEIMGRKSNASAMHLEKMSQAAIGADASVEKLNAELRGTRVASSKAARGIKETGAAAEKAAKRTRSLSGEVFQLQRAFHVLGGALVIREYIALSGAYQNMQNRIKLVTDDAEDLARVQERLFSISRKTRASMGATTETFVRLRKATMAQGVAEEQVFETLTTLNSMLAVSGATAMEAEQGIRQLSQAFSKGKLDGDEFRTVSESLPDILDAITASTGKSRKELRDMSEQGLITTKVLIESFAAVKDKAAKDLENSTFTIQQSFVALKTSALEAVGSMNENTGAIGLLTKAVRFLAEHFDVVVGAIQLVVLWLGAKFLIFAITSAITAYTVMAAKMATASAIVVATNPFLALITAIAVAVIAVKGLKSHTDAWLDSMMDTADLPIAEQRNRFLKEGNQELLKKIGLLKIAQELEVFNLLPGAGTAIPRLKKEIAALRERQALRKQVLANALEEEKSANDRAVAQKLLEEQTKRQARAFQSLRDKLFPLKAAQDQYQKSLETLSAGFLAGKLSALEYEDALKAVEETLNSGDIVAYADSLKEQIRLLKGSQKARDQHAAAAKVDAEFTKRAGVSQEIYNDLRGDFIKDELKIIQLGRQNKGAGKRAKQQEKLIRQFEQLQAKLNPYVGTLRSLEKSQELLNKVEAKGIITAAEKLKLSDQLTASMSAQLEPGAAQIAQAEESLRLSVLGSKERERSIRLAQAEANLKKGIIGTLGVAADPTAKFLAKGQIDTEDRAASNERKVKIAEQYRTVLLGSAQAAEDLAIKQGILDESLQSNTISMIKYTDESRKLTEEQFPAQASGLATIRQALNRQSIAYDQVQRNIETLNVARSLGHISVQTESDAIQKLQSDYEDLGTDMEGVNMGLKGLREMFSEQATATMLADTMISAYGGVEDALVSLVVTGKANWKDLVDTMLADITRLLIRMALMKVISSSTPAGTVVATALPSARHGGTIDTTSLPRFAHGGGFQVGGSGGPDTKLVQFMASPGENVKVTNPGQSRLDNKPAAPADAPVVNVNNFFDPADVPAAMSSVAGERVVLNIVQKNSSMIARMLK